MFPGVANLSGDCASRSRGEQSIICHRRGLNTLLGGGGKEGGGKGAREEDSHTEKGKAIFVCEESLSQRKKVAVRNGEGENAGRRGDE